jgi:hypothetical protein
VHTTPWRKGYRRRGAPARGRRWLLWPALSVVVVIVGLATGYYFFVSWSDRDLREAIAETDHANPEGWQLDDIQAQRERVPDQENAALVVLKINGLLPANWPAPIIAVSGASGQSPGAGSQPLSVDDVLSEPLPNVQLSPNLLQAIQKRLEEAGPALAEAHKLVGMMHGRYPTEWNLDFYPAARSACQLLRYEAVLAAQREDYDRALALVRGVMGAARSIGDEPMIIPGVSRLACDRHAVLALERTLAQGSPSPRELIAMQELLEKESNEPMVWRILRGERAAIHKLLSEMRNGTASWPQSPGSTSGFERALIGVSGRALARQSHGRILRLLNEYVEASRLPLEQQWRVMNALDQKLSQTKMIVPSMPNLSGMLSAFQQDSPIGTLTPWANEFRQGLAILRCAVVAVALERYRRDNGRWPETLDVLVPKYLTSVPTDAQDGLPLRLKRRPDGITIYWIGPTGTYDGDNLNRRNYLKVGAGQGIQLWDLPKRHQSPSKAPANRSS